MNNPNNSLEELKFRKYYQDHPTSLNHNERYIIPLQNQYSILNKTRNPYRALDNFSTDVQYKSKASRALPQLHNQSLNMEVVEWTKRQYQKQNSVNAMRHQISNLSRLVQLKNTEYQMERMRDYNKPAVIPYPVFMPFAPAMNIMNSPINAFSQYSMMGSLGCACNCACKCSCNCVCKCKCKCNCQERNIPQRRLSRKFKTIITQSKPVEAANKYIESVKQTDKDIKAVDEKKNEPLPQIKSPTKVVKHIQKIKKTNALRRWKKCIIAIYFCFYFKWFSFQFSLNRYNHFKEKYLVDNCKNITQNYKEIYLKMLDLDILGLLKESAGQVPDCKGSSTIDISSLLKKQSVQKLKKLSNWSLLSSNPQILFSRCAQFLVKLIQSLTTMLMDWQWGEVGYGLGVGCLNQSFVIDNMFLPHQISLMIFHDGKGYARVSAEDERTLLMIKLIVKLLIYNVCLQLDNNKEWFQKRDSRLKKNQHSDQYFIMLQVATKILFIICQNMYETSLETHETNYDEVQNKFQIEPCNPLVYSHTIKTRRELYKKQDLKESNLLIYGIDSLDEVNQIMKQDFFQSQASSISTVMGDCIEQVLGKLKGFNRKRYAQTQEETLNNQYIILRGLKKYMRSNRYYAYPSNSNMSNTQTKKTTQLQNSSFPKIPSINTKVSIGNKIN